MNRYIITLLFAVVALASCIKNDFPKPTVDLYIASLDVEGIESEIVIDRATYTATIPLKEETDIENVKFNSVTYNADVITNIPYEADASKIVVSKDLNGKKINMSKPQIIYLSYYQTYEWQIVATQTINREWKVDGQMGQTVWDLESHRAIVRRRADYFDRDDDFIRTESIRLGPDNYSYPTKEEMNTEVITKDTICETIVINGEVLRNKECKIKNITVTAYGRSTIWHLIVVPTLAEPEIQHVIGGTNVIWIKANDMDGSDIVFKYRKADEEEWLDVKTEWYADSPYNRKEAGAVKALLRGLEPNATYEVQGWAITELKDGSKSELPSKIFTVTTLPASSLYQMPNSDMEQWGKFTNDQKLLPTSAEGICWYPFSSVNNMFWATGNPGGTIAGEEYNLTKPAYRADSEENVPSNSTSEISAYLGSKLVFEFKFAAGNLFVGHYGETIGTTGATVYFGRPIAEDIKPVALRFKTKYSRGNINCVGDNSLSSKEGTKDLAKVFICLTDWTAPHCVNSTDKTTFFDPRTAKGVLGVGYFDSDNNPELVAENTEKWHTMTIPIEYTKPEGKATHLVVTFTCSGYGDYFTGSDASWMYVDDIELLYDLDDENQPK